jgi:hypothetical protein
MSSSFKWCLASRLLPKFSSFITYHFCYMSRPSHLYWFILIIHTGKEHTLWSFLLWVFSILLLFLLASNIPLPPLLPETLALRSLLTPEATFHTIHSVGKDTFLCMTNDPVKLAVRHWLKPCGITSQLVSRSVSQSRHFQHPASNSRKLIRNPTHPTAFVNVFRAN